MERSVGRATVPRQELELRQVRLSCHAENRRAIRCYEKAGFEHRPRPEGRANERPGEVWMAINRERWEAIAAGAGEREAPASSMGEQQ